MANLTTISRTTPTACGLEILFDGLDALKLNDTSSNSDALNLDLLLEDDDWSEPASSVVDALALALEL